MKRRPRFAEPTSDYMSPIGGPNRRATDREDCRHYLKCLTDAAQKNLRLLPCADCPRFELGVVEREYFQRKNVGDVW